MDGYRDRISKHNLPVFVNRNGSLTFLITHQNILQLTTMCAWKYVLDLKFCVCLKVHFDSKLHPTLSSQVRIVHVKDHSFSLVSWTFQRKRCGMQVFSLSNWWIWKWTVFPLLPLGIQSGNVATWYQTQNSGISWSSISHSNFPVFHQHQMQYIPKQWSLIVLNPISHAWFEFWA